MPQLVKRRRSGWAALAVGALVASLLVVGSPPAGAAEIKVGHDNTASPSKTTQLSACVGDAMRDAGFEDIDGLVAEDAINCLAYYGITKGKTAERFDAGSEVTRSQMALFLYRAADIAGLNLMGGGGAAEFDDIADLDEERQNAIKALARNNILPGNGMAFNPDTSITRAQMAMALVEFLRHANPGLFHQSGTMKGDLNIAATDLDHFADARRLVPVHVETAISYAYELGITTGSAAGADMFSPHDPVLRKNMASFITRTLAHTNVRPAGLTAQNVSGAITASIRDAAFEPVSNEIVDAFYIATASEDKAFDDQGACRRPVNNIDAVDTTAECQITIADNATDGQGNVQFPTMTSNQIGKGATVWVWTGDLGDKFDEDRIDAYRLLVPPGTSLAADGVSFSPDSTKAPHYRFGTSVEMTVQLRSGDSDTKVGTDGRGPAQFSLVTKTFNGQATALPASPLSTAAPQFASGAGVLVTQTSAEKIWSDDEGKVTFALTASDPDPNPTSEDDFRTVQFILKDVDTKNAPDTDASGWITFSDVPSAVTSVSATAVNSYAVAQSGAVPNAVVATVRNQYGQPVSNVKLTLTSDQSTSTMSTARYTTSSTGNVRIGYNHRGATSVKETLTVTYDPTPANGSSGDEKTDTAIVYWVDEADTPTTVDAGHVWPAIVAGSVERNEVVVDWSTSSYYSSNYSSAGAYQILRYDDNDNFKVGAAGATDFATMEKFEEELAKVLKRIAAGTGTNDDRRFRWESYKWDDQDDRALFDLQNAAAS